MTADDRSAYEEAIADLQAENARLRSERDGGQALREMTAERDALAAELSDTRAQLAQARGELLEVARARRVSPGTTPAPASEPTVRCQGTGRQVPLSASMQIDGRTYSRDWIDDHHL